MTQTMTPACCRCWINTLHVFGSKCVTSAPEVQVKVHIALLAGSKALAGRWDEGPLAWQITLITILTVLATLNKKLKNTQHSVSS